MARKNDNRISLKTRCWNAHGYSFSLPYPYVYTSRNIRLGSAEICHENAKAAVSQVGERKEIFVRDHRGSK